MHILFDPQIIGFDHFTQKGSGLEYFHGVPYYRGNGYAFQNGGGVGGVLRSLWRFMKPILKSEGAATGKRILQDIITRPMNPSTVQEAVITEGVEGLKNVLDNTKEKWKQRRQSQKGSGKMRRRKRPIIITNSDLIERSFPKRKILNKNRQDNLGFY